MGATVFVCWVQIAVQMTAARERKREQGCGPKEGRKETRKGKVSGRKSDKTMSFIDQADNVINHSSVSDNTD